MSELRCRAKGSDESGATSSHEPEPTCDTEMKRVASRWRTSVSVAVASSSRVASACACQFSLVMIAESVRCCGGGTLFSLAVILAMSGTYLRSGRLSRWKRVFLLPSIS